MYAPYATDVTPYSISVAWNQMLSESETGRDPIKFYKLEWD